MPELAKQLPVDAAVPRSVPPFAGLLFRISAYAIDLVLIWFIGYSLHMSMKPQLLMLGPFLPFLSWSAFWVYFFLTNGPSGGGKSFGKALLNVRTVNESGGTLTTRQAAIRALAQCPFVVPAAWDLMAEFAPPGNLVMYYTGELLRNAGRAVLLTHIYCVATTPSRQGWHDLLAGSYVTRDPVPEEFHEAFADTTPEERRDRLRPSIQISRWFCIAIFIVMTTLFRGAYGSEQRARLRLIGEFSRNYSLPGYRLYELAAGSLRLPHPDFEAAEEGAQTVSDPADVPAEEGAARDDSDSREFLFAMIYVRRFGPVLPGPAPEADIMAELERIRADMPAIRARHPELASGDGSTTETFLVHLAPRISSYDPALSQGRFWDIRGPLDPAEGDLITHWVDMKRAEERQLAEKREAEAAEAAAGRERGATRTDPSAPPASGAGRR